MCAEPAAGIADSTMRAIERAAQPAEQQRAGLEALRLRSAAMAQLIASSCPTHPLRGHMGRFAAVTDRLDVMLFAVMTMAPVLQQFYDSLRRQISTGRFPPVTLPSGHRDKHEAADRRSRCRHPVALRFSAGPEIISSQRWFSAKRRECSSLPRLSAKDARGHGLTRTPQPGLLFFMTRQAAPPRCSLSHGLSKCGQGRRLF